jgi:hypothetical protein
MARLPPWRDSRLATKGVTPSQTSYVCVFNKTRIAETHEQLQRSGATKTPWNRHICAISLNTCAYAKERSEEGSQARR